jgi:tetratricopeptide (TPR) repeat protein
MLEAARRTGARRAQAFAWCLLGESLLLTGRFGAAAECLTRSTETYDAIGARFVALPWQRLAELAVYRGVADAADRYLHEGLAIASASPLAPHAWGRLYATAALNALEQDDVSAAVAAVGQAAAEASRRGDCPTCSALLHPVAAECYALSDNPERAEEHARAADRVAGYWQSAGWRAMAESASASLAQAGGDPAEAERRFRAAAAMFERAGQPFWHARTVMSAGTAAAAQGEHGRARELLARAAVSFGAIGAVRAQDRAERALARLG